MSYLPTGTSPFFWEKKTRGSDKDRWNCPLDPLPEVDVFQAVTGNEVFPNVGCDQKTNHLKAGSRFENNPCVFTACLPGVFFNCMTLSCVSGVL